MHSDLVITLRKIHREWNRFPDAINELEKASKELWEFYRELYRKDPDIAKNHAVVTYNELMVEEKRIRLIFNNDNTITSEHFLEVLHIISDEMSQITPI